MVDEVFVLGAGCSVADGAPTIASFQDAAEAVYGDPKLPWGGAFSRANRLLFGATLSEWRERFPSLNIEELYVRAEVLDRLGVPLAQPKDRWPATRAERVAYLITKTLVSTMGPGPSPAYSTFVRVLARKMRDGNAPVVVTLNWDFAFDAALLQTHHFHDIDYGRAGTSRTHPFVVNIQSRGRTPVPILRPHGAIHWWYCRGCRKAYYGANGGELIDWWEAARAPECPSPFHHVEHQFVPLMVPPGSEKLSRSRQPILREVWRETRERLAMCEYVTFAGYSFPVTDIQFRLLVVDALRQNRRLRRVEVVTSERSPEARRQFEAHYRRMLGLYEFPPSFHEVPLSFDYSGFVEWGRSRER